MCSSTHSQEDRGDPMMGRHDPPPLVSKLRPASVLPSDEGSGVPTDKSWPQTVVPHQHARTWVVCTRDSGISRHHRYAHHFCPQ